MEKFNLHNHVFFKLTKKGRKILNIHIEKLCCGKDKYECEHLKETYKPVDNIYSMSLNDLFIIFGKQLSEGIIIFIENEFYFKDIADG